MSSTNPVRHYGRKEGQGKYVWSNGDWYEGGWKAGLRHGQGLLRSGETLAPASLQLHTSNCVQGSLNMPERLENIPEAAVSSYC